MQPIRSWAHHVLHLWSAEFLNLVVQVGAPFMGQSSGEIVGVQKTEISMQGH